MERNQIIGFSLIFLLIMAWSIFNAPEEIEEVPNEEVVENTTAPAAESTATTSTYNINANKDSLSDGELSILRNQYDLFAPAAVGAVSETTIENSKMKVTISNKGGQITAIELKDHFKIWEDENGEDKKSLVQLLEDQKNEINYKLTVNGRQVNTKDLFFDVEKKGSTGANLILNGENGATFVQEYSLETDSYHISYRLVSQGLNGVLNEATLEIQNYLDQIEKNVMFEKRYSTVYFKEKGDDSDFCSCTADDIEDEQDKSIEWFSFANQFFNTSYITKDASFDGLIASTEMMEDATGNLKLTTATAGIPLNGNGSFDMTIYAGPNEYQNLKAFNNDLQEVIPFGRSIFGDINRVFIRPFFDWLTGFVSSKGLVIILLIFIIKMALYPLTYKMLHSQAKMGVLKPQIAGLKDKYKDDAQKQQMETMKIYREYGVNPMGGCMPMVIQMPIWYALFRFFPASITFRQEPFLWAKDLSSYDAFIQLPFDIPGFGGHLSLFTVLWAVTTVIYTYYNMRHMDMTANPAMKYVQYLMPLMFFVFFNNYASGLTCYMFFSNLINIAQTVITKKFVFDDEKILKELNIKKAKPKKKGGFQARLEEAMKQQQKIQEQKASQERKKKK